MGKVVRIGGRGTSRRIIEKPEDKWTGEEYKAHQKKMKDAAKDVYVTMGRGTKKIKLGDIAETSGRPTGKASGEKINQLLQKKIIDILNKNKRK